MRCPLEITDGRPAQLCLCTTPERCHVHGDARYPGGATSGSCSGAPRCGSSRTSPTTRSPCSPPTSSPTSGSPLGANRREDVGGEDLRLRWIFFALLAPCPQPEALHVKHGRRHGEQGVQDLCGERHHLPVRHRPWLLPRHLSAPRPSLGIDSF